MEQVGRGLSPRLTTPVRKAINHGVVGLLPHCDNNAAFTFPCPIVDDEPLLGGSWDVDIVALAEQLPESTSERPHPPIHL